MAFLRQPMLFPCKGMCYNRPAVERAVTPLSGPARPLDNPAVPGRGEIRPQRLAPAVPVRDDVMVAQARSAAINDDRQVSADDVAAVAFVDASRFCPVCSQRLESRRCKLVCPVCGYYMSCADYY